MGQPKDLLQRFRNNECTSDEIEDLLQQFAVGKDVHLLKEQIAENLLLEYRETEDTAAEANTQSVSEVYARLYKDITKQGSVVPLPSGRVINYRALMGVAAAIFAVAFGLWFFIAPGHPEKQIVPGKNTAVLTLSNGTAINLSESKSGIVVNAGQVKYNDGSYLLADGLSTKSAEGARSFTLKTPRGGTYQVRLPDGTDVWLNAASSLSYSAGLKEQGARRVKLEGEGYFEVAKDKKHPFIVESSGQKVEVLGTHFNVKNYKDEPGARTTLLEGSVKVISGSDVKTLVPGQQARITGNVIKVFAVNASDVVAWKNGNFQFSEENIQTVMLAISRWYDVEVIYQGPVTKESFGGEISRAKPITEVLASLEETGSVHFKIEGRRVFVMP
ncbi:transmembrane sensor [Pedobacter africanus]|uniref:Uncharacterized protein n=1 Tax=Pedobacter africanus TaxID=151894 RepID=A0ACC6KZ17_9SPHI|nr:FecR domain-containing protein [Pedobacter africanus]MDR6784512.1 hypothetical protein [Pedobacter africanus]